MSKYKFALWYAAVAPGILVAATGVGAGDLLTASFAGSQVGLVILWAAPAGALLKWAITEGVARWQLATDTTLLEGWAQHLGGWIQWLFLGYLLVWSLFVGGALVNACGVAGTGLAPIGGSLAGQWGLPDDPSDVSKIFWGILHSFAGLVLVKLGSFKLFEKLMGVCIGLMFVTVLITAVLTPGTDWSAVKSSAAEAKPQQDVLFYVLAVLGGVGGTVTVLSYGYWIREAGRQGEQGLRACRIDLTLGYVMTALFGMAMIVIGSHAKLAGKGANTAIILAGQLEQVLGPLGWWMFLLGFWGAVFSSLLGVWQSVPYLFADFLAIRKGVSAKERRTMELSRTRGYQVYLYALAIIPLPFLWGSVQQIQFAYAILGAMFMPLLALTLLIMNNRKDWVGERFLSGWIVNGILIVTVLYFAFQGVRKILSTLLPDDYKISDNILFPLILLAGIAGYVALRCRARGGG